MLLHVSAANYSIPQWATGVKDMYRVLHKLSNTKDNIKKMQYTDMYKYFTIYILQPVHYALHIFIHL
jgi:hypothetical protein